MKDLSDLSRFKTKDADTLAQEQAKTDRKYAKKLRQNRKDQAPTSMTQSLGKLLKGAGLA